MTLPRKREPPSLPPPWVRRADWKWSGANPAFRFPGMAENDEITELHRLLDYAEAHPNIFMAWMSKVDRHRRPEQPCYCPQCVSERERLA